MDDHNKEDTRLFKVYKMDPQGPYTGYALIGALDVDDANMMIDEFIKSDPNNKYDSFAWHHVDDDDVMENVLGMYRGFLDSEIYYCG